MVAFHYENILGKRNYFVALNLKAPSGLCDLLGERLLVPAYFLGVLVDSVFF